MLERVITLLRLRRNARRYGIPFRRRANFSVPTKIGGNRALAFPPEAGTRNDFLGIFVEDVYRINQIRSKVARVLDIGANVGFFGVAAKIAFPQAELHAYEPFQQLAEYLEPNRSEFDFRVFYEAVGGRAGWVSLEVSGDSNQTRVREGGRNPVPRTAIADAIGRMGGNIDLAKLDCEGSEWEMFSEGDGWSEISRLAMEYHNFDGQPHDQVARELDRLGFAVVQQRFDPAARFGLIYGINRKRAARWN